MTVVLRSRLLLALVAFVASATILRDSVADDTVWSGTASGDWADAANWSAGVPGSGTNARLDDSAAPFKTIVLPGSGTASQLVVTGSGFSLTTGTLGLGDQLYIVGTGAELTLSGGAHVTAPNGAVGTGATDATNKLSVGSTLAVPGTLHVGYEGDANVLEVTSGGRATIGGLWLGGFAGANDNLLDVAAGGTLSATQLIVGYGGSGNSATIAGTGTSNETVVGFLGSAVNNTLTVGPGGRLTNAGPLTVGASGTGNSLLVTSGTLTVTGGANDVIVGGTAGATGNSIVVDGGSFTSAAALVIGGSSSGNSFSATNGAQVSSNNVRIGLSAGATGNVATVDGAATQWTITNKLRVGSDGGGNALSVTGGGVVLVGSDVFVGGTSTSSTVSDNAITVSGSGSTLAILSGTADLVIGYGTGTNNSVTVANGAQLAVSSVKLGPFGRLLIGTGSAAGTVSPTAVIDAPFGGGAVVFNHDEAAYAFANSITGSTSILQLGTGRTVISGTANTFTGKTIISAGTLALDGATSPIASSSAIEVASGAFLDVGGVLGGFALANGQTLAGKGTVSGTVTSGSGSIVSPGLGDVGTLSLGSSLTLGGLLALDVSGATADAIAVSNALTLQPSSTLAFTIGTAPTAPVYILATYDALTGTFGSVTNLPSGYQLDYAYGGNSVALVAVPEPGACVLAAIGGFELVRRRRRRQRTG